MDGLLGIGREQRAVNSILHNAAKQRKGLVEEVEEDGIAPKPDTKTRVEQEEEGRDQKAAQSTQSSALLCAICRIRSSPYTCPQCNIPYCSVICFRDKKHERCSKPFVQQALDEERKAKEDEGEGENAFVDEEEREKMMDILRRLQKLDANVKQASSKTRKPQLYNAKQTSEKSEDDDQESESEEGSEWEDVLQTAGRAGIDLETANTQELLAMLSAEEREQFQAMIRQAEVNGGRLMGTNELTSEEDGENPTGTAVKWWSLPDIDLTDQRMPEISDKFSKDVEAVIKAMQSGPKGKQLQWNILLVTLSYVYILRHVDVEDLVGLKEEKMEHKTELNFILKLFSQLVPFLITNQSLDRNGDLSRTLLSNAEDVTLWLLARLGADAGEGPAEMMRFLFKEVQRPFLPTSKVRLENDNNSKMMCLLNDISNIASKADRKKIIFYAAYWKQFVDSDAYAGFISEIHSELERLESEVKRTEDEERWRAAHEAIEKHGGVVVPS